MNKHYMRIKPIPLKNLKERLHRAQDKQEFIKEELYILYRFLNDWQRFLAQRQEMSKSHIKLLNKYKIFKNLTGYADTVNAEIKQAQEHINALKEKIKYLEEMSNYI